jgi:hypothetical protein
MAHARGGNPGDFLRVDTRFFQHLLRHFAQDAPDEVRIEFEGKASGGGIGGQRPGTKGADSFSRVGID